MPTLLHLDSSAHRSPESVSRALTALYADAWRVHHPGGGYRHRDLAADPVPPLTSGYCALGRRLEREVPQPEVAEVIADAGERREWELTRVLVEEIHAADTVLVGVPMCNYSVPATLKAWIDRVCFPGALTDLSGLSVVVVATRGGGYRPGSPRAKRVTRAHGTRDTRARNA
jgi:FMN-dependent NADH-azoreductase